VDLFRLQRPPQGASALLVRTGGNTDWPFRSRAAWPARRMLWLSFEGTPLAVCLRFGGSSASAVAYLPKPDGAVMAGMALVRSKYAVDLARMIRSKCDVTDALCGSVAAALREPFNSSVGEQPGAPEPGADSGERRVWDDPMKDQGPHCTAISAFTGLPTRVTRLWGSPDPSLIPRGTDDDLTSKERHMLSR